MIYSLFDGSGLDDSLAVCSIVTADSSNKDLRIEESLESVIIEVVEAVAGVVEVNPLPVIHAKAVVVKALEPIVEVSSIVALEAESKLEDAQLILDNNSTLIFESMPTVEEADKLASVDNEPTETSAVVQQAE